jgi:Rrf2 family protein
MLRLSTKSQYGVRAMFEIANSYPAGPVTIKEISEKQSVSIAYLEQILNILRKAGIIRSVKGPGGGYVLNKNPENISIGAILRELDGPVAITSCLDPKEGCMRVDGCVTHLLWKSLGEKIEAFLDNMTLKDLLEGQSVTGLSGKSSRNKKDAAKAVPVRFKE